MCGFHRHPVTTITREETREWMIKKTTYGNIKSTIMFITEHCSGHEYIFPALIIYHSPVQHEKFGVFMVLKIQGLLVCDAMQCCSKIPMFQRNLLPFSL
jgi:hypothetical protein